MRALRVLAHELVTARNGVIALSGNCGSGKTLLLQTLVAEFCRRRIEARYYTANAIADALMPGDDNDPSVIVGILTRLPVVVIDELDKIEWTPWRWQNLNAVIDYRTDPANYTPDPKRPGSGLVTVFAMNLEPAQWLAKPGISLSAIESRLSAGLTNRYWPADSYDKLPPCLVERDCYDLLDGKKRYYIPGWFRTTLADIRPNLRQEAKSK